DRYPTMRSWLPHRQRHPLGLGAHDGPPVWRATSRAISFCRLDQLGRAGGAYAVAGPKPAAERRPRRRLLARGGQLCDLWLLWLRQAPGSCSGFARTGNRLARPGRLRRQWWRLRGHGDVSPQDCKSWIPSPVLVDRGCAGGIGAMDRPAPMVVVVAWTAPAASA